jgi:uncharacterized protein
MLALLIAASAAQPNPSKPDRIRVESDRMLKMRDGVRLAADLYRPAQDGKYPVLLVRTPYGKITEEKTCRAAAARGYICVAQDVRGRYRSEGEWYPFKHESSDGFDTVEWAASLPGATGQVGMFGDSYVAATQWLAAIARPPHLMGILPVLTPSDYHDGWVYQGGALELWFDQSWTSILAGNTLARAEMNGIPAMTWAGELPESGFPVLPAENPAKLAPYFLDWLAHPDFDDFWKPLSIEQHYSELQLPANHVAGWYDIFLRGTLRNYLGMRAHAATRRARDHQRLTIGPWVHDGPMDGKAGDIDFGGAAGFEETDAVLRWYDELFRRSQEQQKSRVRIFVMGVNQWRDEDDWPVPGTVYTRYYLDSSGHANSSSGDGTLSTRMPAERWFDAFTYAPDNPVPTHGGGLCCTHDQVIQEPSGAFDQREVERRNDVLVYSTESLSQDLEVTGLVGAEVYVSSSAVDTDVTAKLVDVRPDGFAQNLTDNVQRLRYRNSPERPELLEPGKIYKIIFEIGATSNVFRAGHRIRLEISSSNFPRFDRNLNSAASPESGATFVPAENRIYHDAQHPSAIVLPVIPKS